MYKTKKRKIRC